MKLRPLLAVGACVTILLLFFFLVPFVWTLIIPCLAGGYGYASLSYYLLHIGEVYIGGQLMWSTTNYSDCF